MDNGLGRFVISKTPMRITFTGGSTDIPEFYKRYGPGAVVNATVSKYIHVIVSKHFFPDEFRISYSVTENAVKRPEDIRHPIVREGLRMLKIRGGMQIISITDVPSNMGLGSSSAFTVGLLNSLHAWKSHTASAKQLSEEAVTIEREILKEAGGKQDQYAAAYGGMNYMQFNKNGSVTVKPIHMKPDASNELKKHLLMLFIGMARSGPKVESDKIKEIDGHIDAYSRMRDLANETYRSLQAGNIREVGEQLHENWVLKRSLSQSVSSSLIDKAYEKARKAGAIGGKVIGAGGGGFFMFFAPPERHKGIARALNLKPEPFQLERSGSKLLHM